MRAFTVVIEGPLYDPDLEIGFEEYKGMLADTHIFEGVPADDVLTMQGDFLGPVFRFTVVA